MTCRILGTLAADILKLDPEVTRMAERHRLEYMGIRGGQLAVTKVRGNEGLVTLPSRYELWITEKGINP